MGWLASLFHKEKKYEKTITIILHNNVIGQGNNLTFTQLPNEEYCINYIEFHMSELIFSKDTVNLISSLIGKGVQQLPFNVIINETNKKPIEIVDATISDFGRCIINNMYIIYENVTLTAKVNNMK